MGVQVNKPSESNDSPSGPLIRRKPSGCTGTSTSVANNLTCQGIPSRRTAFVIPTKTGDSLTRVLTPACLDLVDAMLKASPDGRILGWACGKREAMRLMRAHLDAVGIGGTSKFLRRSGATHCEMQAPGSGRLHLGHRSPALFEQAYADWGQLRTKTPKTPALI